MFYVHDKAESHFYSINGRPEFKIIVPSASAAELTMMVVDGEVLPFQFPNQKPELKRLLAKDSKWVLHRISFTDNGLLLVFSERNIELSPENSDTENYDSRDWAVSCSYESFKPSPDGIAFYIDIFNVYGEIIESYDIFVSDEIVVINATPSPDEAPEHLIHRA